MRLSTLLAVATVGLSLGACSSSGPLGALNEAVTIRLEPETTSAAATAPLNDFNMNDESFTKVHILRKDGSVFAWGRLVAPTQVRLIREKEPQPADGQLVVKASSGLVSVTKVTSDSQLVTLELSKAVN